ncbi:hypothetical protein Mycsm_06451 [Mycobacterium sp. JS623]|nr:hypothetical protein Mycsm_06451 [Mycobacterium sp. JS623]
MVRYRRSIPTVGESNPFCGLRISSITDVAKTSLVCLVPLVFL